MIQSKKPQYIAFFLQTFRIFTALLLRWGILYFLCFFNTSLLSIRAKVILLSVFSRFLCLPRLVQYFHAVQGIISKLLLNSQVSYFELLLLGTVIPPFCHLTFVTICRYSLSLGCSGSLSCLHVVSEEVWYFCISTLVSSEFIVA